jgi:hypothetical protein
VASGLVAFSHVNHAQNGRIRAGKRLKLQGAPILSAYRAAGVTVAMRELIRIFAEWGPGVWP